ncbi:hypothetical protein H6G41_30165 [Tolypothrix sp. FACHB-123]|uniref:hypothetical protein n=1 Tax=Tolypothrix sp. FACHB-123 TaxID=2692868 RepID=UPI00168988BA|nr:hypothetical protein [Tolypothrix sp. FACHB-123]MBD2358813.1 hypothetical protein [Tolypothrix sp. FACHB-123]
MTPLALSRETRPTQWLPNAQCPKSAGGYPHPQGDGVSRRLSMNSAKKLRSRSQKQ